MSKIESLQKKIEGMKQYLLLKFDHEDWHGVMDAAADIRELEAEIKGLRQLE
jgi:hypothetical protein